MKEEKKTKKKQVQRNVEIEKVLIVGRTGVGKSSLVNAFQNRFVAKVNDISPETKKVKIYKWDLNSHKISLCDTPGIGVLDAKDSRKVLKELSRSDTIGCILYILDATNSAYRKDFKWCKHLVRKLKVPLIVVLNRIDLLNPVQWWNPSTDNFKKSSISNALKAKNVRAKFRYVKQHFKKLTPIVIPIVAGTKERPPWNINALEQAIDKYVA